MNLRVCQSQYRPSMSSLALKWLPSRGKGVYPSLLNSIDVRTSPVRWIAASANSLMAQKARVSTSLEWKLLPYNKGVFRPFSSTRSSDFESFSWTRRQGMRCLAVVAHVDHGKTSLVDRLLQAASSENGSSLDRLLDSGDLEKERGITITSKVTRIEYVNSNSGGDEPDVIINLADR